MLLAITARVAVVLKITMIVKLKTKILIIIVSSCRINNNNNNNNNDYLIDIHNSNADSFDIIDASASVMIKRTFRKWMRVLQKYHIL